MPTTLIRRQLITNAFAVQYPELSLDGIYCQFTGKRVGTYDIDEIRDLMDSIEGDAEAVADDLAIRILAAQRPSMRWNKLNRESIDTLRKRHPRETLAYLFNRLMQPISNESGAEWLELAHDRVRLCQWIESMDDGVAREWLFMLIEIDAKLSLTSLKTPITTTDLLSKPLDSSRAVLNSWYTEMQAKHLRDEKAREQTTQWYRSGNTMSKSAHVSQFMESQPPSQARIKADAKQKDRAVMSSLLRTLMADAGIRPLAEGIKRPPVKPINIKPTIPLTQRGAFGGKMPNFGKKES